MDFDNIDYLQYGNNRQREAFVIITDNQILLKLARYHPILVGTIPINIHTERSDLDIICYFTDQQDFTETIVHHFTNEKNFSIRNRTNFTVLTTVASFSIGNSEIEIFGQNIPTKQQHGYLHLIAEYNLLEKYGEKFRQQIVELKRQKYKTEPAFAVALGIKGDPYTELLKFETNSRSPDW